MLLIQWYCSMAQPAMALRLSSPAAHFSVSGWFAQCRSSTAASSRSRKDAVFAMLQLRLDRPGLDGVRVRERARRASGAGHIIT